MKATARRASNNFTHTVTVRQHALTVDEPPDHGGDDEGPNPQELLAASLASCTAITLEMYARHKGWELGPVEVDVEYDAAERGAATRFHIVLRIPNTCTEEQVERIQAIARKCPVHRTLEGEVTFDDSVELVEPSTITP